MIKNLRESGLRQVIKNFGYLSILQGTNYIFPLITFPYLVRVLGITNYGQIVFVLAIIQYFKLLVDYGFSLIGAREVSQHREDNHQLSNIYSSIIFIKSILLLSGFILLILLLTIFAEDKDEYFLYLISYGIVIGSGLFSPWFFQGVEKMLYITVITIVPKVIYVASIFIFINNEFDYNIVLLLQALTEISIGFISLVVIRYKFNVKLVRPDNKCIKKFIREGWHVLLSNSYVNLYTTTNIVILRMLVGVESVGLYAIAEKIITAITALCGQLIQALFPYLSRIRKNDGFSKFAQTTKAVGKVLLLLFTPIAIIAFISSGVLVELVSGDENPEIEIILKILAITVLLVPLGAYMTRVLLIVNKEKYLSQISRNAAIINFILVVPLIIYFDAIGLAACVLMVQCYIAAKALKIITRL
jgi:PST family polysaccharide transporter